MTKLPQLRKKTLCLHYSFLIIAALLCLLFASHNTSPLYPVRPQGADSVFYSGACLAFPSFQNRRVFTACTVLHSFLNPPIPYRAFAGISRQSLRLFPAVAHYVSYDLWIRQFNRGLLFAVYSACHISFCQLLFKSQCTSEAAPSRLQLYLWLLPRVRCFHPAEQLHGHTCGHMDCCLWFIIPQTIPRIAEKRRSFFIRPADGHTSCMHLFCAKPYFFWNAPCGFSP